MSELLTSLRDEGPVRVIVLDSANPEFFTAHVDMTLGEQVEELQELAASAPEGVDVFQAVGELLRHQPQVTIVELAGIARGGGAELVAAVDLAFAAVGSAGLGQVEALMGLVPGGGGTQYLANRIGRHRALEVVLGADLHDAETAERYGWVDRALPADQLDGFVERLVHDIADLPEGAPAAGSLVRGALSGGAQTREGERDLEGLLLGPSR